MRKSKDRRSYNGKIKRIQNYPRASAVCVCVCVCGEIKYATTIKAYSYFLGIPDFGTNSIHY